MQRESTTEDKDKTPLVVPGKASGAASGNSSTGGAGTGSTISRLESKYSDILDRVHRRKEQEDKEKTLEPPSGSAYHQQQQLPQTQRLLNPLMKSSTTASIVRDKSYSSAKERTPYKLQLLLGSSRSSKLSSGTSSTGAMVDSLYDRNGRTYGAADRSSGMRTFGAKESSYHQHHHHHQQQQQHGEGGKENVFKSKYDPTELLSEVSGMPGSGGKSRRTIKPYKRSDTTDMGHLLHSHQAHQYGQPYGDGSLADGSAFSASASSLTTKKERRKSTAGGGRFFDADGICTVPLSSDDDRDSSGAADATDSKDPRQRERQNRRREIESLLQKYAPLDDPGRQQLLQQQPPQQPRRERRSHATVNPSTTERSPRLEDDVASLLLQSGTAYQRQRTSSSHVRMYYQQQHQQQHQQHQQQQLQQQLYGTATTGTALGGGLQKSYTVQNVASHLLNGAGHQLHHHYGQQLPYGGGAYHHHAAPVGGSILPINTGAAHAYNSRTAAALAAGSTGLVQNQLRGPRSRIPKALSTFVRIAPTPTHIQSNHYTNTHTTFGVVLACFCCMMRHSNYQRLHALILSILVRRYRTSETSPACVCACLCVCLCNP